MTVAAPPDTRVEITPEELLAREDCTLFELVDGQLVEVPMSVESGLVAGRMIVALGNYCDRNRAGWVFPGDVHFRCFPDDPQRMRKPDASFISGARLGVEEMRVGECRLAPDLAVEVISPNDLYRNIERKVSEYLDAGVRLVWVIDPETRSMRVHRPDLTAVTLNEEAALTGEDVLPGFSLRVGDLFPAPPAPSR